MRSLGHPTLGRPLTFFFFLGNHKGRDASSFFMRGREERGHTRKWGVGFLLNVKRCGGVEFLISHGLVGLSPIPNRIQDLDQILTNF